MMKKSSLQNFTSQRVQSGEILDISYYLPDDEHMYVRRVEGRPPEIPDEISEEEAPLDATYFLLYNPLGKLETATNTREYAGGICIVDDKVLHNVH